MHSQIVVPLLEFASVLSVFGRTTRLVFPYAFHESLGPFGNIDCEIVRALHEQHFPLFSACRRAVHSQVESFVPGVRLCIASWRDTRDAYNLDC